MMITTMIFINITIIVTVVAIIRRIIIIAIIIIIIIIISNTTIKVIITINIAVNTTLYIIIVLPTVLRGLSLIAFPILPKETAFLNNRDMPHTANIKINNILPYVIKMALTIASTMTIPPPLPPPCHIFHSQW